MTLRRSAFLRTTPDAATLTVKVLRQRSCRICTQSFRPWSTTQTACSPDCARKVAEQVRLKAERKDIRERRERAKTRGDHIADAQVAFNAWIRARDAGRLCISCDTVLSSLAGTPGGGFDAGHYRSRGSAPHLRFDERNCHGQCKKCNRYKSGNAADYRINLVARIGIAEVLALEAEQEIAKWSIPQVLAIKALYRDKLKQLKAAQ